MAAKSFISSYTYVIDGVEGSSTRNVPQGKKVTLKLEVGNSSTTTRIITAIIKVNNVVCRESSRSVSPGAKFRCECSFNMGTRDVTIDYYAFSGTTVDAHESIHLTAGEDTCAQTVQVHKKGSTLVIRGVQIEARPSTGSVIRCTTGSNGRCTLNLIKDDFYDILISSIPTGYECQYVHDCEKRNVMACGTEIEFYLKGEGVPEPPSGERWRHIDSGTWKNGFIEFAYEMENPLTEKLDSGKCRYYYRGSAHWDTKHAEGHHMSACTDLTGLIHPFSLSPGDKVDIQLDRFDELEDVWLKSIDRETVTIPEKEEVNKITITVGSTFDAAAIAERKLYCGEVVPFLTSWIPKPIGYEVCKKDIPATRIVEFTATDGLVVGHHYVYTIYPIVWLDQVLNGNVFEFKGTKAWTIQDITFIHKPICNLLGIPPESQACKDEVAEFIDVVYAYNTIQKIVNHTDMHGTPAEPETLDYFFLPLVVAGSFLPIPVGKAGKLLSRVSGKWAKLAETASKKAFLLKNQKKIHQLAAIGDDVNLRTFDDNLAIGNLQKCQTILDQAAEVAGRTEAGRATMRANLGEWVKGIRNKWKTDPGLKTKIDDLEKGADGNIFKSFESTISSHFDDAVKAGDWKKASEIWHGAAMSVDDMWYLERNLAKYSPEFKRMHNIMRYSSDDFIKVLKTEKAAIPEFANRFDEGVDYLIRHIGEETGQEVGAYKVILDAVPASEVATIVKNLTGAGKEAAGAITYVLKADTTKGMTSFYGAAAAGMKGTKKLSKKEAKAAAAALRTKLDDAAKALTPKEKAAMEKVLTTDDPVKHPKLARFWKYIHGADSPQRFREFPLWKKAAIVGAVFFVADAVWKKMMDFCMALFMGEETIQWAGFGGIVLNSLTYDWDEKPLSERIKLIEVFTEFKENRQTIHDIVTNTSQIFEVLCLPFAHIYRNFWEADTISIKALGTKIEYMEKGIDPLAGIGDCTLIAQADKKGVAFYVHGETQKYYSGAAFSKVYVPGVIVRDEPYKVILCVEKDGYVSPQMAFIRITEDDINKKISTPLFNMIPDTEAGSNPFGDRLPYTDEEYNAHAKETEVVRRGKIVCSTAPTGAKIYLDGVYKNALTNWTLEYVPVGKHTIVFKKEGYADCTVDVMVAVEPHAQAYCNLKKTVGSITFKCAYKDDYCTRGATIEYRKEGTTKWESFGEKTSSYPPIKKDLLAGVYEVKYNLLDVMGCEGKVTVKAGETVDFNEQMSSLFPTSINTTVKKIVDGDSIRTARTDILPVPSAAYTHQEVRIIGYDAFECENYPTKCTSFGKYGGDKLKELIPVGSSITLKIDKWHPLGVYNRIIAVVHNGHVDIASEMLKSCLVIISERKYQDKYSWINWVEYNRLWCDPTEVVASAGKHPTIVDVDTQKTSFRVKNPWLTLNIWAKFFPSNTSSVELLLESGKTSAPISYTVGTTAIQLFACLGNLKDKKKEWIEVDKWFVTPTKKVTFESTPAGASVSVRKI